MPAPPAFDPRTQRRIPADCLSDAGWTRGVFHVPASQAFADYLQFSGTFLPLTDAVLPYARTALPFFALHTATLSLVVPDAVEGPLETEGSRGITSPWSVSCLLADGVLQGSIDFLTNQRLSDFLKAARGFLVVRNAIWQSFVPRESDVQAADGESPTREFSIALVNIARLAGIADAPVQRGHGHPGRLDYSETPDPGAPG